MKFTASESRAATNGRKKIAIEPMRKMVRVRIGRAVRPQPSGNPDLQNVDGKEPTIHNGASTKGTALKSIASARNTNEVRQEPRRIRNSESRSNAPTTRSSRS